MLDMFYSGLRHDYGLLEPWKTFQSKGSEKKDESRAELSFVHKPKEVSKEFEEPGRRGHKSWSS